MRKLALAALVLLAAPVSAALHPDAYANGINPSGNTVYCVTGDTGAEFCLNNVDPAGLGFNDPTVAAPVGGNPGTTIGEQRINAYMESFRVWGQVIESTETIWVQGTFQPLSCSATSGVLGAAGAIQIWANFDDDGGPSWPITWYPEALANRLSAENLSPGSPDPGLLEPPFADDIVSFFNSNLGTTGCLEDGAWYYGFDAAEDVTAEIDFLQVLTHEVGHGLGHANTTDEDGNPSGCASTGNCASPPGSNPNGWPDIYNVFTRDNSVGGRHWNQMSDGQRAASAVSGELYWDGPTVYADAPGFLLGRPIVRAGSPISADFEAQAAAYTAPPPADDSVTAEVVVYNDGAGADSSDGCDCPFGPSFCTTNQPLDPNVNGKIALLRRGGCTFALKSAVAEFAGAIGVIIDNNQPGLPPMGGGALIAHDTVSVGISAADGAALRANPGIEATIRQHEVLLAGADDNGFPGLYAPNPVAPGSSVSHWDTTLTPNALMEPFINSDLDVVSTLDLSPAQMADIGWDGDLHCPVGSDDGATVVIDGCDTGVDNAFGPWTLIGGPNGRGWKTTSGTVYGGCYVADLVHGCAAGTPTHGDFVACVGNVANGLRKIGAISTGDADDIKACAEGADIP